MRLEWRYWTPSRICLRNWVASSSDRDSFSARKSKSSPPDTSSRIRITSVLFSKMSCRVMMLLCWISRRMLTSRSISSRLTPRRLDDSRRFLMNLAAYSMLVLFSLHLRTMANCPLQEDGNEKITVTLDICGEFHNVLVCREFSHLSSAYLSLRAHTHTHTHAQTLTLTHTQRHYTTAEVERHIEMMSHFCCITALTNYQAVSAVFNVMLTHAYIFLVLFRPEVVHGSVHVITWVTVVCINGVFQGKKLSEHLYLQCYVWEENTSVTYLPSSSSIS